MGFPVSMLQQQLCFKLPFCLLCQTRDSSVSYSRAKSACFVHMQQQNVEINMNQVSYSKGLWHICCIQKNLFASAGSYLSDSSSIIRCDSVYNGRPRSGTMIDALNIYTVFVLLTASNT